MPRVRVRVRVAAALSNIVYVGGEALIWRYDAVDVETANGLGATGPA